MAPAKKETRTWVITAALSLAAVAMALGSVQAFGVRVIEVPVPNGDMTYSIGHMSYEPYVVGAVALALSSVITWVLAVWVWLERLWTLAQHAAAGVGALLLIGGLALTLSPPPVF
jgi:hypothetical protein